MIPWILYAIGEGFLWGCIFSHNGGHLLSEKPYNVHISVFPVRLLFFMCVLLFSAVSLEGGTVIFLSVAWEALIMTVSLFAVFPFWQNGTYYLTRHLWEPDTIHYKFWSKSTTTTARINLGFPLRTALMVAGTVIWIIKRYLI